MSGELVGLLSAVLWAVSSVLLTVGAKRLHVIPLNLVRCTVSAAFFLVLLPFYGGLSALAALPLSVWLGLTVSVLALLVVGDTLYFGSLHLAGVSWAMPVASINPLWVVLLASVLVDEPLSWSLVGGAVLVVLGIAAISREPQPNGVANGIDPKMRRKGLLMALAVSVLWAVGQVALKPATAGIHAVVANSVRLPMAALLLLGMALFRGRWRELRTLDRRSWGIILLASFIGTAIGTLLFVATIQLIGAGPTSILVSASPVMAIPFSMLWLGERPTRWTVFGTLLTIAGLVLIV